MGAPAVVVLGIGPKRSIEMPPTEDERPVEALGPDRLDHPLGMGIRVGSLDRRADDPHPLRPEHRVERPTDPELAQLAFDPHAPPAGVLPGHPEDEHTDLGIDRWPARTKPLRPGQVERHTHDYTRNGTRSLFAALEVATGTVTTSSAANRLLVPLRV